MGKLIDITGSRYNRLIVLEKAHVDKDNFIRWKCKCDCGKIIYARAYPLKKGIVKSCGCLNNELRSKRVKTHGRSKDAIYRVWKEMKARCYNENNKRYSRYGGRGITICEQWLNNPTEFIEWAETNGYKKGLTIDRKDNNGNYSPDNCRFTTTAINNQNSSNCKINLEIANQIRSKYKNESLSQKELVEMFGVTQQTISKIVNNKIWKN